MNLNYTWRRHCQSCLSCKHSVPLCAIWREFCLRCIYLCQDFPGAATNVHLFCTDWCSHIALARGWRYSLIQGCWINSSHFAWRRYFLFLCKCKHLQLLEWMYFSNMFGPVAGEDTKGSNFTLSFVHGYTWVIPIWYASMSFCTNKSQMENRPPVSV